MSNASLVFVHSSDELYGADRMLLELVAAVPDGMSVEVWLPTDLAHSGRPLCEVLEERGVAVRHLALPIMRRAYRTPRGLLVLAGKVRTLAAELRRVAPDVVYCTTSAAYLAVASARMAHVGTIICHAQEFWLGTDRRVLAPLAKRADRLVVVSHALAAALPMPLSEHAVVIANATRDPDWSPPRDISCAAPLQFLVASRWSSGKGHRTLFAAWERAGCPGILTVLGAPPPTGEGVDVNRLAAELRQPLSVRIVGEVSELDGYFADTDVVVIPSDSPEGFGLIAIEGFARARPVIASSAGALPEVVSDGESGWLFEPGDVGGLADILLRLGRADVVAAGEQARRVFEKSYTVGRYRSQWAAMLVEALSHNANYQ